MGEIKIIVDYGKLGQYRRSKKSYEIDIDKLREKINILDHKIDEELDRAAKESGVPIYEKRTNGNEERRTNGERRNKL